jgi:hypothetical protein
LLDSTEERFNEAELYRVKGELLLAQNYSNAADAEFCFRRAIDVARQQSAKSFELRATVSLARLLAKQGHPDAAHRMVADIYNWFTEGFDTAESKLDASGCSFTRSRASLAIVAPKTSNTVGMLAAVATGDAFAFVIWLIRVSGRRGPSSTTAPRSARFAALAAFISSLCLRRCSAVALFQRL